MSSQFREGSNLSGHLFQTRLSCAVVTFVCEVILMRYALKQKGNISDLVAPG